MRAFIVCSLLVFLSFCRSSAEDREMKAYFDHEIKNRREILDQLSLKNHDSLKINTAAIDEEINNYILMSRDIENISAAINRSNAYFLNMSNSYGINYNDFTKLSADMHLNEIALVLKQNELNLLNQLIFKSSQNLNTPYTAQ